MNLNAYGYVATFKNPDVAQEVYKRFSTIYRARGESPVTHIRLDKPRVLLSENAIDGLDGLVEKIGQKFNNIRYEVLPNSPPK